MKRWLVLTLPLLLACGSAQSGGAEDPSDVSPGEESEADVAEDSEQPHAETTDESANEKASSGDTSSASAADLQTILQLVIDDDALTPYLHLEEPERFPLKIAGSVLPSGVELSKANKPVKFVDASEAEDKKKAVLVFTEFDVKGDRATVAYRYDIERVRGSATVVKADGTWTLLKSRITERAVDLKR